MEDDGTYLDLEGIELTDEDFEKAERRGQSIEQYIDDMRIAREGAE